MLSTLFFVPLTPYHNVRWALLSPPCHRSGQGGAGSCSDLPKAPQWGRVRDRIWLQASLNLIEEGGWIQFCETFVGIKVGILTSPAKGSALWKNTMLSCWDGAQDSKGSATLAQIASARKWGEFWVCPKTERKRQERSQCVEAGALLGSGGQEVASGAWRPERLGRCLTASQCQAQCLPVVSCLQGPPSSLTSVQREGGYV